MKDTKIERQKKLKIIKQKLLVTKKFTQKQLDDIHDYREVETEVNGNKSKALEMLDKDGKVLFEYHEVFIVKDASIVKFIMIVKKTKKDKSKKGGEIEEIFFFLAA